MFTGCVLILSSFQSLICVQRFNAGRVNVVIFFSGKKKCVPSRLHRCHCEALVLFLNCSNDIIFSLVSSFMQSAPSNMVRAHVLRSPYRSLNVLLLAFCAV